MPVPPAIVAALAAALFTFGCAHEGPWIDPSSAWTTATGQRFVVHSDASRATVETITLRGEQLRAAIGATFFAGDDLPEVEAMVFASGEDYEELAGKLAARFVPGIGRTSSLLVARGHEDGAWLDRVLAHELVHRFARARYPNLPPWLEEGLALYLATLEVRGQSVMLGLAPARELEPFADMTALSLGPLLEATRDRVRGPHDVADHATAWAVVHYLVNGEPGNEPERFPELLRRLNDKPRDQQAVLEALYPGKTLTQLENAAFAWAMRLRGPGVEALREMPLVSARPRAPSFRPAGRNQVRELCLALYATAPRRPPPRQMHATAVRAEWRRSPGIDGLDAGLELDRLVWGHNAAEVDLGAGTIGWQVGLLARHYFLLGGDPRFLVSLAIGPSLAVKSRSLGNEIQHEATTSVNAGAIYYMATITPQLAFQYRADSGPAIQLELGVNFVISENFSRLCPSDQCIQLDGMSTSEIATRGGYLHLGLSAGWSW